MNDQWKELLENKEAMKDQLQKMLKNKKVQYWGIGIVVFVLIIVLSLQAKEGGNSYEELLDLGNRYLEEMDYESAIAVFDKAISIEPKDERGYIGKATAEFQFGLVNEAIETLYIGLATVPDSITLEELLQQFQESQMDSYQWDDIDDTDVNEGEASSYLILNYTYVSRKVNTENAQIQLEVVGNAGPNSHFTWSSSYEQCATVSEDGLLTCLPQEGYATISVSDGNKIGTCDVRIFDGDSEEIETVSISVPVENSDKEYFVSVGTSKEDDKGFLADLGSFVYYSGTVEIPEHLSIMGRDISLTEIASGAFGMENKMTSFRIPASVEEFDGNENEGNEWNPFVVCSKLTEIQVDEKNQNYQSIDGVLYSKDGKKLIAYPMNKQEKTFVLPKKVEIIYAEAFRGCSNLEEIRVEDGNEFYEVLDGVLIQKTDHKLLVYPAAKKGKDYTVPDGIESIASYAFCESQVENVTIGDSVEQLAYNTFYNCSHLKSLNGMRQIEEIESSVFNGSNCVEEIGGGAATKEVSIFYTDKPVKLLNASEMVNLERLRIHLEDLKNLSWLEEMKNLQVVSFHVDSMEDPELSVLTKLNNLTELEIESKKPIELNDLPRLENLESLHLCVKNLQDISSLGEMKNLQRLELMVNSFTDADLSVLIELDNLQSLTIYGTGQSGTESLSSEAIQQLDMLKENNPDCNIYVAGY